jgi:hypothetical protein
MNLCRTEILPPIFYRSSLGWGMEILEGTGVGTINPDSGFFVARSPGCVRVALLRDDAPYDHSGPLRVLPTFNQPTAVTIKGGPAGIVSGNSASFTWSGVDQDCTAAGYYYSLNDPSPATFTGLVGGTFTFYIRAEDDQGALSPIVSRTFTVSLSSKGDKDDVNTACFIVSALGGTFHPIGITAMREFRDRHLKTNALGRVLVRAYYRFSPAAASFIKRHRFARTGARMAVTSMWRVFFNMSVFMFYSSRQNMITSLWDFN